MERPKPPLPQPPARVLRRLRRPAIDRQHDDQRPEQRGSGDREWPARYQWLYAADHKRFRADDRFHRRQQLELSALSERFDRRQHLGRRCPNLWSLERYRDLPGPKSDHQCRFTYSGNQPTWNITGLVYLPHANVTFSGAVGKSSNASSGKALCFELVVADLTINGTGDIFANDTQCSAAGLAGAGLIRGQLVN